VIFVDIGGIVDFHSMSWSERWFMVQYQQKSPLTSTHWVMVNNSTTNINKNHPSIQLIEWWSTIPPISTLKWEVIFVDIGGIVDITQWVEVWCDFCWYWWNCWPSLNELRWEVIFVDIGGGIVDHHLMSCGEKWLLLILVELLTINQWVMVRGVFLLILVQFHQYQQKSPLT
jgi:beta-lactamase superfamily II metal-dependent hydrolase